MSRSTKLLVLAVMAVLIVARPTALRANTGNQQQPGILFKSPAPAAGGTLDTSVRLQGVSPAINVNTRTSAPPQPFVAVGGESPAAVASAAASRLCAAADSQTGVVCTFTNMATCTFLPTAALVTGAGFSPALAQVASCPFPTTPTGGFKITQPAGPCATPPCPRFFLDPLGVDARFNNGAGLQVDDTNCGGYQADILPLLRLRVVPGSGIATINVIGTPSGSFTVDTSQTDAQIQTDMCTKFGNLGLITIPRNGTSFWIDPTNTAGNLVEVEVPTGVTDISVDPPTTAGTHTFAMQLTGVTSNIPTLSGWGIIVLVALLVLTSVWMLRKRQNLQSN